MEATKEEQNAINSLARLGKRWPDTLWVFATGNGMHILRKGENGEHVMDSSGTPDLDYQLGYVTDIDHDGGDF